MRLILRIVVCLLLAILAYWIGGIGIYRFVDPPGTPLMVFRLASGNGWHYQPVRMELMAPDLGRAVIAAEDNRFCQHRGVDFDAVATAIEDYQETGRARGASTITMQVARNLFLWQGGGVVRKAFEVPLAFALELAWPKRRILEVYLNIAEWGRGVYGAAASAERHFRKVPANLTTFEASLMAAVLPSPRRWKASKPTKYIEGRAAAITGRMSKLSPEYFRCVGL